uniref:Sodium-coupled neutral amino acid transporter 7 n=1 Tax=Maylandia zebra TaxID=106582 RepID=A0A3P9C4P0_9CICH
QFMLIFIITGLVILGYCSLVSNEATYQEVVRATCGKVTGVVCEVAIAIYTFGTCIAFFIVIGDQLDRLIAAAGHNAEGEDDHFWYTNRKFTISLTAILVILPLSIPKEIGFQKYASTLSVMGTWYVTIVVIIKYFWPDKEVTPGYVPTSSASWTAVFNAMPTICFGFQCHVSSVPVFNSMRRKEIRPWGLVVTFSMLICLFVYTGTGVCGFLTFGSNVSQDVLMSAFIIVCVVTSYPILHFCGRAVIEGLWLRSKEEDPADAGVVYHHLVLASSSRYGRVISLIGGLAACFIFVFPGTLHAICSVRLARAGDRFSVAMVTLGAFIFGLTTTNSIYQDVVN